MALRRQPIRNVSSESQCLDEDTEEDEAAAGRDNGEELSSLLLTTRREKRWTERENESKPKEMTEEEMMDLALHMSKQEASVTALRRQEEEDAVMKAIQESMVGEMQPSPTLLADSSLGSRRKLSYPNRNAQPAVDDEALEDSCLSETHLNSADRAGDGKRKAGSPLQQMPDSQASPNRLESSSVRLDSPQSSDSILIKDSQFQKSPVFPRTICRAAVHVDRLDQHLVETCRNSGFVLCSQDSWTSSQKSAQSPTFPRSSLPSRPKSPIVIDLDQEGNAEAELSAQFAKSPVFGRNTQKERLPSARKHQTQCVFSSQESLTPSAKSASCWPNSPVFPKSPGAASELPPSGQLGLPDSPDRGQIEPCRDRSMSPVFGLTSQQRVCPDVRTSVGLDITGKDTKCDGLNAVMRFPQSEELDENPRDWNSAEPELTSDMTLVWSDEDDAAPVGFPSPVFPGEQPVHQAEIQPALRNHTAATERSHRLNPGMSGTVGDLTSSGTSTRRTQEAAQEAAGMASAGQAVHYYWGVPFCPRGLDPDTYTQVIMAQMEVYEKSLKRAQRCLLRKAEWGEAILPQPEKSPSPEVPAGSPQHYVPRRRGLRLRGRETKKAAGSQPAEAEEGEREDEEQLQQQMEKDEGDEEQMKTDDCEVCPETPLKDEGTQDLMMDIQTEAEPPCKSSERPEIEVILPEDSPAGEEPQEEDDASVDERMEINVDPGGQSEEEKGPGPESRNPVQQLFQPVTKAAEFNEHRSPASWNIHLWGPDMNDVQDEGPPRSSSPEPEPAIVPQSPKVSVDCPICQTSFPVSEIEMHAAYCDGEVAVVDERGPESNRFQESLKPRRKRFRKMEETNRAWSAGRNQEKCYICQKAVSLRDYGRHTDLCLQRQPPRSAAAAGTSHRYKPTAVSFQRGNLLSALEQADNRKSDAGPSGSRVQPEDVIDLRDDDDDDEEASAFRISNSPIRAFTPISEATDCLIDFKKQQQTKKPSQRRR